MNEDFPVVTTDVFIAGSGPIGAAYARKILDHKKDAKIFMAEIGSQDSPTIGAHHKNSIKYQKDIDSFVHVIQGALQPISIPPEDTFMSTLGEVAWSPINPKTLVKPGNESKVEVKHLTQSYHNPNQKPEVNLKSFMTRTVGGMATHWTCACPYPAPEEKEECPIESSTFDKLLKESHGMLGVSTEEFNNSIRHQVVKKALEDSGKYAGRLGNLPLSVKRRKNQDYVTWGGVDTVLKHHVPSIFEFGPNQPKTLNLEGFNLSPETRVTKLIHEPGVAGTRKIVAALVRDLGSGEDYYVVAKKYVIACGAIGTCQVLYNSDIAPEALGKNLAEQSLTFCQIVLKREFIDAIPTIDAFKKQYEKHHALNPNDPLPIPWADPEPQVTLKFTKDKPYHVQIHRDAFAYGGVGPRADPRVVVDLRFFGRQDIKEDNRVEFEKPNIKGDNDGNTDGYGMPQATFWVARSDGDAKRDHDMMADMCEAASILGAYLPGSEPQFMEPGLVLHITGTTRVGKKDDSIAPDKQKSVANEHSLVHVTENVYVGGNGVIPDSTACNPTLTSVAYAIHGANHIIESLYGGK